MIGFPVASSETPEEFYRQIVNSAADPLFVIPKPKDTGMSDPQLSEAVQRCRARNSHSKAQQ